MIEQVRIELPKAAAHKDKGDFLEDLCRSVLEIQRYEVTQRLRFTATEVDLLCTHMDRKGDSALVECKARATILAEAIKNFAFDLVVSKRAQYGYFVHTSELQQAAAGLRSELETQHSGNMTFIGPTRLIDWLEAAHLIAPRPLASSPAGASPTKTVLLYTPHCKAWVTVYALGSVASHYSIRSAVPNSSEAIDAEAVAEFLADELEDLERIEADATTPTPKSPETMKEVIAEIQESQEWADLRPVGSKFFVGRSAITQMLYRFVRSPLSDPSSSRLFFVEGKSGWGKSSLLAHLRARARNRRNRNTFFALVLDARGADTAAFVGMSVSQLIHRAADARFVPSELAAQVKIPSWFDTLSDPNMTPLFEWLSNSNRVLVLAFDQFEDVFRKHDVFRAFHKLMMDTISLRGNLVLGFSWRSEINIPIDNPAYALWQQARQHAVAFPLEQFSAPEVDGVISQLQQQSGHQLPTPLKRRLKESSQGFPWLIKKLATHCYHEMKRGLDPDELVDQDLNVQRLFDADRERLSPDEARSLKFIAQRGYDGDPFDITEVDDKVDEAVLNRLLTQRLVIRTGGKYTVYWDIFRDYLVEEKLPRLYESFLLRQYPTTCVQTLEALLQTPSATEAEVACTLKVSEGTAGNFLRELRNLGAITKSGEGFVVRAGIASETDFREYIKTRLDNHVAIRALRQSNKERIEMGDVVQALRTATASISFSTKTWHTYAKFLTAWLRYCAIDLGRRLVAEPRRKVIDPESYTPQTRPEKLIETVDWLSRQSEPIARGGNRRLDKPLYDLKAFGLLTYGRDAVYLTKVGTSLLRHDRAEWPATIAALAYRTPKIRTATEALQKTEQGGLAAAFEDGIRDILNGIDSSSYRTVTASVLKSWGRFVMQHASQLAGDRES